MPVSHSPAVLRFHLPLIEPDGRISRIRLSEKAHAFALESRCRGAVRSKLTNPNTPYITVQRVVIPSGASDFVFATQPPAEPHATRGDPRPEGFRSIGTLSRNNCAQPVKS